jgi:hypothetical protein
MGYQLNLRPLENGLEFLLTALDHLSMAAPEFAHHSRLFSQDRHLKYAVLAASSSMELLLKQRLIQEHWSLVFKNMKDANRKSFDDGAFASVTFDEIVDRLHGICGCKVPAQKGSPLRTLRDRRNRLEHFGIIDSFYAVSENVSAVISYLIDFTRDEIDFEETFAETNFISGIRERLGICKIFEKARWEEISAQLSTVSVVECPTCQKDALVISDGEVECLYCTYHESSTSAADWYLWRLVARCEDPPDDGGSLVRCPKCLSESLVPQFSPKDTAICFRCGQSWKGESLGRCGICSAHYERVSSDFGICGNCVSKKSVGLQPV